MYVVLLCKQWCTY